MPIERIPTYPMPDGTDGYIQRLITALEDEATLRVLDFDILKLSNVAWGTATWNPGELADGATSSVTVTVIEASPGDIAFGSFSSITAGGWQISAIVTATDQAKVTITNHTGGAINLAEGTVNAGVFQYAYPSGPSAEEIKESYEVPDGALGVIGDTGGDEYIEAAEIVNSGNITCTGASAYIESETGAVVGDLTFRLETNNGGEPSGTLAHANATYAMASGAVTIAGWNRATFAEFSLVAGTYWLVLSVPAQENNIFYAWSADASAGTNTRCYNINGGAWIDNDDIFLWRLLGK